MAHGVEWTLAIGAVQLAEGAAAAAFERPDWVALGLVLAVVGCFLLANGILFRHPRTLVEERFGRRPRPLRTIREFIFHRVQMALGFTFLLAGFALQLLGRALDPGGAAATGPGAAASAGGSLVLWIGLIVVLAIALEVAGWWWSLHSFRRYLRDFLRDHPPEFESDMALAREVGELFGIASHEGDTVQTYVARLRRAVGLATEGRRADLGRMPLRVATEPEEPDLGEED